MTLILKLVLIWTVTGKLPNVKLLPKEGTRTNPIWVKVMVRIRVWGNLTRGNFPGTIFCVPIYARQKSNLADEGRSQTFKQTDCCSNFVLM